MDVLEGIGWAATREYFRGNLFIQERVIHFSFMMDDVLHRDSLITSDLYSFRASLTREAILLTLTKVALSFSTAKNSLQTFPHTTPLTFAAPIQKQR
jgi:hypothetical protein